MLKFIKFRRYECDIKYRIWYYTDKLGIEFFGHFIGFTKKSYESFEEAGRSL